MTNFEVSAGIRGHPEKPRVNLKSAPFEHFKNLILWAKDVPGSQEGLERTWPTGPGPGGVDVELIWDVAS